MTRMPSRTLLLFLGLLTAAVWLAPTDTAIAGDDGKGGAFLGGMIGGHVLTKMVGRSERRTQAQEYQAYGSQQQPTVVYQQVPAQPAPQPSAGSGPSIEQRLQKLDELAAKGYISPEEYKARRKAILDSL